MAERLSPGLHTGIPAAVYHADPCPEPSLSASVAGILLDHTPLHAWTSHPRLNPKWEANGSNAAMDIGSVAHEMILGRGAGFEVLEFEDWRTKAAKEAREAAIAAGRTPILLKQAVDAEFIALAVRRKLDVMPDVLSDWETGSSEVVMVWQDGPTWCRAMIDRLTAGLDVFDIKTTAAGLSDDALSKRIASGYDLQAAFYLRGLATLHPEAAGRMRWHWVFVETAPPYAVRIIRASNVALGIGAEKANTALALWQGCLSADHWPGYPTTIEDVDYPGWAATRWQARLVSDDRLNPLPIHERPKEVIFGERRISFLAEAS